MTKTGSLFNGVAYSAALLLVACSEPAAAIQADPVQPAPTSVIEAPMVAPAEVPVTEAPASMTAQLNPAHGGPGHDCAIPVGAPLDGSGAAVNTSPAPTPVTASVTSQVNNPASGTGMLNPAHGEPGHDCAVPVGSPLPG